MQQNSQTQIKQRQRRSLWVLVILFLLFFVPFLLAGLMYSKKDTFHTKVATHGGELIQPPLDLAQLKLLDQTGQPFQQQQLKGKWVMVYLSPGSCDRLCEKNIFYMRQIRTATNKDQNRVLRLVISFTGQPQDTHLAQLLTTAYQGTLHAWVSKADFMQFAGKLRSTPLAIRQGYLYLVDPLGNVMMGYPADANSSGIFKDLTRLLKVSQIG